jgi:hypothetical protein
MYNTFIFIFSLWFFLSTSAYFLLSRLGDIAFEEFLKDIDNQKAKLSLLLSRRTIRQSMRLNSLKVAFTTGYIIMLFYIFFDSEDFVVEFKKEFKAVLHTTLYKDA